jgi:hypothetical protein
MNDLLAPGYYKGKILDYGVKRTKKGDPAPTIAFGINGAKVYWQGSWNGKGMDFCMEALLTCGLENPSRLMHLAEGQHSGVLDTNRLFDLTVEVQVADNDPSKKWNRVAWINSEGGSKFKDAITVQEFAADVSNRNLVAELMRVAEAKGFKLNSNVTRQSSVEIPF